MFKHAVVSNAQQTGVILALEYDTGVLDLLQTLMMREQDMNNAVVLEFLVFHCPGMPASMMLFSAELCRSRSSPELMAIICFE